MMKVREMGGEITENSGYQYRIGTLHQVLLGTVPNSVGL